MKMTRLDDNNAHDWLGGQELPGEQPGNIHSSWSMRERVPPPPRPERWVFYIDRNGITVAQAETVEQAVACAKRLKDKTVIIRPHLICEKSLCAEERVRKEVNQYASTY